MADAKNPHGYAVGQRWLIVVDTSYGQRYVDVTVGKVGRRWVHLATPGGATYITDIKSRTFIDGGRNAELFHDRDEADAVHAARRAWAQLCRKCVALLPPPGLTAEAVRQAGKLLNIEIDP